MSIYSNVTEQDLINLRKIAQQQKEQRALKIKNRILKQTHDEKLAESLTPITKRLDLVENKKGEKTGELLKKSEEETLAIENTQTPQLVTTNTQTPAIENASQSLRDTLSFMKKSKNFFKLEQDGNKVFWNKIPIKPLGENRISIDDNHEYDIKPNIQEYFTNTKQTTKNMDDEDKIAIYDILTDLGFYSKRHAKGTSNSRRFKDAFHNLPNEIARIRNTPLPAIENDSNNLQGEGVKIIIPNNIIDIYTRLEGLLGLKLSGHTDTLTEASNLLDELYKRGEIQNKQQYRNAINKFQI